MATSNEIVKADKKSTLVMIKNKIYEFRGEKVMLDRDLAELYGVETRILNQAVKRNIERFPEEFMFQLNNQETANLKLQFATSNIVDNEEDRSLRSQNVILNKGRGQHSKYRPYAFTEQGVAMLSAVLKSPTAVAISIDIMKAFVELRHMLVQTHLQTLTVENIRLQIKQLEDALENNLAAVNDLSEDMRHEIDNIYQVIAELSVR